MSQGSMSMIDSYNLDTMTLEKAMAQYYREEFVKDMHKTLEEHICGKNWKIVPSKYFPKGWVPITMVCSTKRKINPILEITKWDSILFSVWNISIEVIDYCNTYSRVVSWITVWLMICMALLIYCHMQSVNFFLALPQDPIKADVYMRPLSFPKYLIFKNCNTHQMYSQNYTCGWKTYMVLRMLEALDLVSLNM